MRGLGHRNLPRQLRCCNLSRIGDGKGTTSGGFAAAALLGAVLLGTAAVGGCTEIHHGYMAPEGALEQLPLGSTQEQVLIVLGTPSTVATISGEVFYYISQRDEQFSFLPERETDRRVIAVYFDKNRRVQRLADYGLKQGKVFDYVSRTTPSGGREANALNLMFRVFKSQD
ncbi:MAG: outer membrane protein assembly factor BamE [Bradyrhizobiaceae bacterium]|nr:outer membrane protein assembly factor BamE [Bradyrhizobiaceae bacterium]